MQEELRFMAQHILSELNKLGIVKDAQVNPTTIKAVAGFAQDYMDAQKLQISRK